MDWTIHPDALIRKKRAMERIMEKTGGFAAVNVEFDHDSVIAMSYIFTLAIEDQRHYLNMGGGERDYGPSEWPDVARAKGYAFKAAARVARKMGLLQQASQLRQLAVDMLQGVVVDPEFEDKHNYDH